MRFELKMLLAVGLIALILFGWAWSAKAERLIIYNCELGTAIGWVTWDGEPGPGGSFTSGTVNVYGKAVTVIDPAEHKVYAITQFKWSNNSIVGFQEIRVKPGDGNVEVKFSCTGQEEF